MKKRYLCGGLLFLLMLPFGSNAKAGLIFNGDFESSTLNTAVPEGWTVSGFNRRSAGAFTGNPVVPVASGAWALDLGPSGTDTDGGGTISQTFAVSTAGLYQFSFDYTNESNLSSRLADFSWSLTGTVTDSETLNGVGGGYENFSRSYQVNAPGNITVSFTDIVGNGHAYDAVIDNVSFSRLSSGVIPEPSSIAVFLTGVMGLSLRRRRP